ncbi:ankyrin repeat-containing protein [Herbaspirillum sp. CF444]|uniref:ankyrin repeat domain-containing protein n=1 Tax=Herbaspirillum sp. CF444 TaxID=1144319 RepID=UPI00027278F9|nr:ankyrin repeat domain-containing protein [Herbaspirillum sp. CF444]EJL91023.1 ankyrin repeat-containing protein [Herbaspirillum sp. CF444]
MLIPPNSLHTLPPAEPVGQPVVPVTMPDAPTVHPRAASQPSYISSMQARLLSDLPPPPLNTPQEYNEARNQLGVMLRGTQPIDETRFISLARQVGQEELNKPDATGFTPLSTALLYDRNDLAALLRHQGARPSATNEDGSTAGHIEAEKKTMDVQFKAALTAFQPIELQGGFKTNFNRMMNAKHIAGEDSLGNDLASYRQQTPAQRAANYMVALRIYSKLGATIDAFNEPSPGSYGLDVLIAKQKGNPELYGIPCNEMQYNSVQTLASLGHNMRLKRMIAAGGSLDAQEPNHGWTALHAATAAPPERIDGQKTNEENLQEAARILVESGADVRLRSKEGDEALHGAAAFRDSVTTKLLLDAGADPNAKNNKGVTPMHRAAATGNLDVIRMLVAAGGNIDTPDNDGKTPRDWAGLGRTLVTLGDSLPRATRDEVCRVIDELRNIRNTENPASLQALDEVNLPNTVAPSLGDIKFNALQHAATGGDVDTLRKLIAQGVPLETKQPDKDWTALQLVLNADTLENLRERSAVVKDLAEAGANVNLREENGMHVIHRAAMFCAPDAIAALAKAGADLNARNGKGYLPPILAAAVGEPETFQALLDHGSRLDAAELKTAAKFAGMLPIEHPGRQAVLDLIAIEEAKLVVEVAPDQINA